MPNPSSALCTTSKFCHVSILNLKVERLYPIKYKNGNIDIINNSKWRVNRKKNWQRLND